MLFDNYGSFCVCDVLNKYCSSGILVQQVAQMNIKAEKFT